jgi:hypothetical protein
MKFLLTATALIAGSNTPPRRPGRAGRDGSAGRRDDLSSADRQLNDHDLVKRITFWCFPTCTG